MSIRIFLTGKISVDVDGNVVLDERRLRGRQGRLAFAYLACERTRPVSRNELARIIWPDEMASSWEVALSALISRLRGVLSVDALKARDVSLASGFGQHRLWLPTDAWTDLERGASAIDRAESALRSGEPGTVLGPATVAATVARRPFLPGIEGEWVESQRRKLDRQLIRALECLAQMRLGTGEPGLAVETAIEAVERDPLWETSYQLLMRAYVATGNRPRAIKVYHDLREILAQELGTEPSAETESLYLQALG